MAKENKDQLMLVDPVIVSEGANSYHNPMDFTEEMLKKISNLPSRILEHNQFTVECQGKTAFHDIKNGTMEERDGAIRVIMTPFIS